MSNYRVEDDRRAHTRYLPCCLSGHVALWVFSLHTVPSQTMRIASRCELGQMPRTYCFTTVVSFHFIGWRWLLKPFSWLTVSSPSLHSNNSLLLRFSTVLRYFLGILQFPFSTTHCAFFLLHFFAWLFYFLLILSLFSSLLTSGSETKEKKRFSN